MADHLYVCLQDEDKIVRFAIDAGTGGLTPQGEVPAAGGPSVVAISPDGQILYVGHRTQPAISSFRIDRGNGGLTPHGSVACADAPTFLATDRSGKYLLGFAAAAGHCAFYLGSTVQRFPKELKGYDTSKGTIRFDATTPLPSALVRKLVKARVAERATG